MQQLIDGNLREYIQICETKSDPEVQGKLGEMCHLLLGHVRHIRHIRCQKVSPQNNVTVTPFLLLLILQLSHF